MGAQRRSWAALAAVALVAGVIPTAMDGLGSPARAVGTNPTTVTVASTANPSVYGQTVNITATVTGAAGTPTGTVNFVDGTTSKSKTLDANGVATWTTSFSVGTHSIATTYNGNATYAVATAPTFNQVSNQTPTTTTLTSNVNPSAFGSPVTLTAFVAAAAPGNGSPSSGSVKFYDGPTQIGSVGPTSGTASLVVSNLAVGTHTITASFGGSTSYLASTSTALSQVVTTVPTTTTITPSVNPATFGTPVTFTAVVGASAGTPTGSVTFLDGASTIGTATLAGGQASITSSSLSVGAHSVTAAYTGAGTFAASTSAVLTETIESGGTTTSLGVSPSPAAFGAPVTLTASVTASSGAPGGTVTFRDGATVIGTGTLESGEAAITVSTFTVGDHALTASYEGDATFTGSVSVSTALTVTTAPTTTTVTASVNPVAIGDAVTFTASVGSGAGTPTGSVTFRDGPSVIGTVPLAGGSAALTVSSLVAGDHGITATYEGDAEHAPSTSALLVESVGSASTATALLASPSPASFGQTVTLTATVTGPGGTPTGSVTFRDGDAILGTAPLTGAEASIQVADLTIGSHSLTATYGGDPTYLTSTSPAVQEDVGPTATITDLVVAPNPASFGTAVTLTATVTSGAGTPTGTVTFLDGGTPLGTSTLAAGQATLTTSALAGGLHALTASYAGDATNAASTSASVAETVDPAPTTTALAATPNPSGYGDAVTLTATVASTAGTPTGTVTFADGATTVGSASLASGQATIVVSTLGGGSHGLIASYGGSADHATSASAVVNQTVDPAPTTTALAASPNPSTAGSTVTMTATVNSAVGSPTGTVTFRDGTATLGTAPLAGGQATLAVNTLSAGSHALTAAYAATADFAASASPTVTETVNAGNVLYVNRTSATCVNSGSGAGTSATPYCTISGAASKATAGTTVVVAAGTYPEGVGVQSSGTAAAPITFTAAAGATVTVTGGNRGFSLSNRSWVVIRGFTVTATSGVGLYVSGGSNVTLEDNHVYAVGQPVNNQTAYGIKVSGSSQVLVAGNTSDHNTDAGILVTGTDAAVIRDNVTFANARQYTRAAAGIDLRAGTGNQVYGNTSYGNEDSGINVWTGTAEGSNAVFDNVVHDNGDHGIDVHNAVDARIIANTVVGNYDSGIEATTSIGTLLANNVSVDNGIASARTSGNIRIDKGSVATTTVNDDLVFLGTPGVMIDWNGVKYASLEAFRTATGQESRGIEADPGFVAAASADFHLLAGSPAIDSANSGALNQPATDFAGATRYDDPATTDTGIGPVTYADRGAYEYRP